MKNFTIHLALLLCLFAAKTAAQDDKKQQTGPTFEMKAKMIAVKIDAITKEEKAALKAEVENVNKDLEAGKLTRQQADDKKLELAEIRAKNIETRVAEAQNELNQLVKDRVDGKIKDQDSTRRFTLHLNYPLRIEKNDEKEKGKGESRTTSQFVFAFGANNLVTNSAVANSDYRYWGSHFYEWGITWNTRLAKNNNLLHAKYGFSVMYNNLRPTDNRYFVENDDQTSLETAAISLKDSRFRNVNLVFPLHLEFDFTKKETVNDKVIFNTHEAFRFGIGGFAGVNLKSKQILKFEDADGNDVTQKTKGDFNTNDFIYGVSAYVGYGPLSLYAKYDISPLFKDNAVDQHNVSMGVRFDFN
jgi:hypothetical protein